MKEHLLPDERRRVTSEPKQLNVKCQLVKMLHRNKKRKKGF